MDKEYFKILLGQARYIIADSEANKNLDLMDAFHNFYDELAPSVFAGFSAQRIHTHGFKLYVQQVLDIVYELARITEARNKKNVDVPKQTFSNVLNLNDFRKTKNGSPTNGNRSLKTS